MDRMTDVQHEHVSGFYDWLAPDYDMMTGFESRFAKESPFFRTLAEKFAIHTALDAGCGTGFHSLVLARLGIRVTAIDISSEMIVRLREHSGSLHLHIDTVHAGFLEIPSAITNTFDAVVCLGNSLVHLLTPIELEQALRNFFSVLEANGTLFVQLLNYDRIMASRDNLQNVREINGKAYTRSYEYDGDKVRFSIRISRVVHELHEEDFQSIEIRPILKDELLTMLTRIGFTSIEAFGNIALDPFELTASRDLVILARKCN